MSTTVDYVRNELQRVHAQRGGAIVKEPLVILLSDFLDRLIQLEESEGDYHAFANRLKKLEEAK